jgi:hypothetical protein
MGHKSKKSSSVNKSLFTTKRLSQKSITSSSKSKDKSGKNS